MVKKSRGRVRPQGKSQFSEVQRILSQQLPQEGTDIESIARDPEAVAVAKAFIEKVYIPTVSDLDSLAKVSRAVDIVARQPLSCSGNYLKDWQALLARYEKVAPLQSQVRERRSILERRAAKTTQKLAVAAD